MSRRTSSSAVEFGAGPPAPLRFVVPGRTPAAAFAGGIKFESPDADTRHMDAQGARLLAARIRAGVRVGAEIELVADDGEAGLRSGDRGVVTWIGEQGGVVVRWDRGFTHEIDPEKTPFRSLAA